MAITPEQIDKRIAVDYYKGDREALKRDTLAALGLADHPKADDLFRLSCEIGTFDRLIWAEMRKLAVLLRD